ncbi:MAG: hypothetical protein L0Z62_42575 [Gemmataceae bacterium]|nr:hypothetical protein [Gemmataceae bacterium]
MRKLHLLILLLVLPAASLAVQAQDPASRIFFTRERQFWIPFDPLGPMAPQVKQLQLHVSTDQGRHWEPFATVAPEQKRFHFTCQADGLYWFAVQTHSLDGRLFPPTMANAQPSLKVYVDTLPPIVSLRPLPPRAGEVGVAWDIRDDHLDLTRADSIQLEYRTVGSPAWIPLQRHGSAPQLYWAPETNGVLEVRLRAYDRARNEGKASTNVSLNPHAAGLQPGVAQAPAGGGQGQFGGAPVDPNRRLINSKTVRLNFEIKDKGPSGISLVELWVTQDGRSWGKHPLAAEQQKAETSPLVFAVEGEGVYGFTVVARSGVGLGARPPQLGDRPDLWVEVDLTRPVVHLHQVIVGQGPDKGKLTVMWTASDKNLHATPISITYSEQPTGPWQPMTADRIANTGRYVWTMPAQVPYQFHVKVEALDSAGNIGEAVTSELVKVDLSQPRVKILNVEPGK